ncbi:MAG: SDR family oxidoreductase [Acidobacteriota bacterium]|nr:SDR family oxidoreductase [Acidobacteriota bacterium]
MNRSSRGKKRKLLVTGWSGFVAGSVITQAQDNWEVHGVGRTEPPGNTAGLEFHRFDLLDHERTQGLFDEIRPDAVIHAAAIADIDYCQRNQNISEKVNVDVTANVSRICEDHEIKFVFCSTDNVFDGKDGFYSETDSPNAVNFYGETKIRSEEIIKNMRTGGVIARVALVIGLPVIGRGNSFLSGAIERWKAGLSADYPDNEIRTPIDVITLGRALIELAGSDFSGTIHLAGNSRMTRYEMSQFIAEKLGYKTELNLPINSNSVEGRAPRPDDVSMDNSRAKSLLRTPMLSLLEGLNLALNYRAPYDVGSPALNAEQEG